MARSRRVDDPARERGASPGGGSIACGFHARDAHLVLSRGAPEPIPFRVLLDGEAPGPSAGVDVDEDGNGVLRDDRMYQLVRQHDVVRDRTLEITLLQPGAKAHSFTFG
jgi:Thioredoxin like C-terminal domain